MWKFQRKGVKRERLKHFQRGKQKKKGTYINNKRSKLPWSSSAEYWMLKNVAAVASRFMKKMFNIHEI